MKKILIVINTMGRAGAEKSLISLLNSIDYSRVSVSLFSIVSRGEMFLEVPKEVKILNRKVSAGSVLGNDGRIYIIKTVLSQMLKDGYIIKFIPFAIDNTLTQLKSKHFQFDKLLWLLLAETAEVFNEEYDMAIAFLEGASTYYVANNVKAKKKLAFVHVNYVKAGYIKKFDKKHYKKMDYICCISDAVKQIFSKVYPEFTDRIRMFPNIISTDQIRSLSMKSGGFSDGFMGLRLLTVARLHQQKGLDVAIAAFAKLVELGYDNIRWYVLGDGSEKSRLLKLIDKYNLNEKFILLGSHDNPYPYMAQCDIYIQPSRFEGFPLTLQEALILNKPCITTNFPGVSDLLHNGKDAVVVEFSRKNITGAIKRLVDNKGLRESISGATHSIKFEYPNKTHVLYDIMDGIGWDVE